MSRFTVRGGTPMNGTIRLGGAKNSVLKLMAATLLAEGESRLRNVPDIADVDTMAELLRAVGASVAHTGDGELVVKSPSDPHPEAPYELVERMRASIVVLGPLLARCGRARVSMPGGDDLGSRPIDLHLRGLEQLGAVVELEHGWVEARAERLIGAEIVLEYPSVGATENLLMASVLAEGETTIDNAAREPEITDLAQFLVAMGAQIEGIGSSTLVVQGVSRDGLHAADHTVVPDRVEAVTFMAAVGTAGGDVVLETARPDHLEVVVAKLLAMGLHVEPVDGGLRVAHDGSRLRSVDLATLPYPGVATDYKPFLVTLLSIAEGVGIVSENLYADRFRYLGELVRMGANVRHEGNHTVVRGVTRLQGARVKAHDIRAGAALIVAGIGAEGTTTVDHAEHIVRGYQHLDERLRAVGVDITYEP